MREVFIQKIPAASSLGWSEGGPSPAAALLVLTFLMEPHKRCIGQVLHLQRNTHDMQKLIMGKTEWYRKQEIRDKKLLYLDVLVFLVKRLGKNVHLSPAETETKRR